MERPSSRAAHPLLQPVAVKTSRATLVLLLALLPLACKTPAPFDTAADCPKETYCGQCASRGGCSWCGDPADGSRGQCVAVGRSECAAPSTWAKTPDTCAPPPLDATNLPAPVASSTAAEAASPVAKALGPAKYAAIRNALTRAFPSANVTDEIVASVAAVLAAHPKLPPGHGADTAQMDLAPVARHVREKEHHLYLGKATHHRVKAIPPEAKAMQSEFMLALPMVRVTLPASLTAEGAIVATEIGDVDLRNDHLLGSVDLIAAKYGGAGYLGARPERVDLITPPRSSGSRFAAIALYLGYRHLADRSPSFYLLEAGTATGDAKMIYFSPDMKPIKHATSYYLPTPFVSMRNTYDGALSMRPAPDEGEPERLVVESRAPGAAESLHHRHRRLRARAHPGAAGPHRAHRRCRRPRLAHRRGDAPPLRRRAGARAGGARHHDALDRVPALPGRGRAGRERGACAALITMGGAQGPPNPPDHDGGPRPLKTPDRGVNPWSTGRRRSRTSGRGGATNRRPLRRAPSGCGGRPSS